MVTSSVLTSPKEQALTLGKLTPKSDLSQLEVSASSEHNIHQHGIECPTFGSSPLLTQADRALELHKLWQARAAVFFSPQSRPPLVRRRRKTCSRWREEPEERSLSGRKIASVSSGAMTQP